MRDYFSHVQYFKHKRLTLGQHRKPEFSTDETLKIKLRIGSGAQALQAHAASKLGKEITVAQLLDGK